MQGRSQPRMLPCESVPGQMDIVSQMKSFESVEQCDVSEKCENTGSDTLDGTISEDNICGKDTKKRYGVKRARSPDVEQQSSLVHVTYRSLPKKSKKKLEELLLGWSEWHSHHFQNDSTEDLESGEETYYPALALYLDTDKSPTMSFISDVPLIKKHCKELAAFDRELVPLYDRGYSTPLCSDNSGSESKRVLVVRDDIRCFNCGAYDHSLKGCSKPRDNAAIADARKQHQAKKKGNDGPRIPRRYFQESAAGKYDGLKQGSLSAETRQLLGIGEQDPPPWHHKMRELGCPPGPTEVEAEAEEQPSGITIITGDEVLGVENQDRTGTKISKKVKLKSARFPEINSPTAKKPDPKKRRSSHPRGVVIPMKKPNSLPNSELYRMRVMPDPSWTYGDLRSSRISGVTSPPDSFERDYRDVRLFGKPPLDKLFWDNRGYGDARFSESFRGSPKHDVFWADGYHREDVFSRSLGISPTSPAYFSRSYPAHMTDCPPKVFSQDPYLNRSHDRWGSSPSVQERFPIHDTRDHLPFSFSPPENYPVFPARTYRHYHLHDGY